MAYQWTSNAAQTVTTDPGIVVPLHRRPDRTVAEVIEQFVAAAEIGAVLNRSGRPYRPSAMRDVRGILEHHVVPAVGEMRLRDVRRREVQLLVDQLAAGRLSESRIRSVISALRAMYGYAIERGYVEFNPADGLVMPAAPASSSTDPPAPAEPAAPTPTPPLVQAVDAPPDPPDSAQPPKTGDRPAADPWPLLPDRMLTLALRAALVLFILVVLVSLLAPI